MVWVRRDLKDHLVPTPCHGQGHLPLDQLAQSPIQPGPSNHGSFLFAVSLSSTLKAEEGALLLPEQDFKVDVCELDCK